MSLLLRYAERCGMAFDMAVNALFGGAVCQTVSLRAAIAQRAGNRWGCWFCGLLSALVQRGHCAAQFTDAPTPGLAYVRAGVAFGIGGWAAAAMIRSILHLLESISF